MEEFNPPNKWKRYAIDEVLAEYIDIDTEIIYDVLQKSTDLVSAFKAFDIAVWEQFEDFTKPVVVELIRSLAENAARYERYGAD